MTSVSFLQLYHPVPHRKRECGPNTLTRAICRSMTNSFSKLSDIHNHLCNPGVTRLLHFVRTKNLLFSTDDVKKLWHSCRVCRTEATVLPPSIKYTQGNSAHGTMKHRFQRTSQNTYMLTIVDEYSRFPFAFHCPNTTSATVMKCLDKLFVHCGTPSYAHSDRGLLLSFSTPLTFVSGGSPIFPLVVYQPSSPSSWPVGPSLHRGIYFLVTKKKSRHLCIVFHCNITVFITCL